MNEQDENILYTREIQIDEKKKRNWLGLAMSLGATITLTIFIIVVCYLKLIIK